MKHKHHIIPRHMGGTDDPSNIVELTIPQHAAAHKRLYKQYGKEEDLIAYRMLSGQITAYEANILATKSANAGNNYRKGKTQEGDMARFAYWKDKKRSEEHKKNISKGLMGHVVSQSQKDKVAKALSKTYIINGKEVTNLRQFCIKNGLDQGNMTKVAQGILKSHKGYTCSYKY